jgi:hypothetical protein
MNCNEMDAITRAIFIQVNVAGKNAKDTKNMIHV